MAKQEVAFVFSIYLLVLLVSSHIIIEAAQHHHHLLRVVSSSGENGVSSTTTSITRFRSKTNPFTPKAYVIRYWNTKISNNLLRKPPSFLLSKASPLTSVELAFFTNLLSSNHSSGSSSNLSTHLPAFCASANLFCNINNHNRPIKPQQPVDANFTSYTASKSFTTYGGGSTATRHGSTDSFANYSVGVNMPTNTFTHYSPTSSSSTSPHSDRFSTYSDDANVGSDRFSAYAATTANAVRTNSSSSSSGSSTFIRYETNVNVPNLIFTSYDSRAARHNLSFASYTENANSGREAFVSYGKNSGAAPSEFGSYGESSNILRSTFTGYGEEGRGPANDSFKGYGGDANNPSNDFKGYGVGGNNKNGGVNRFANYRDGANVGEDSFQVYGEAVESRFVNYGRSLNNGSDTFKEYGKGGAGVKRDVGFRTYAGVNNTFKGYGDDKKGITFAGYRGNASTSTRISGQHHRSMWVEEGRFFRESMLRRGTVMKMPDIRDKMPNRSFLPLSILSKLPPMTRSGVEDITAVFGSGTEGTVRGTVEECERAASRGERKRCVGSVEDMIDFAVGELGRDVVVMTTEGLGGAGEDVVIGKVRGGTVGRSVSCHQSLFPYLVYYCHSVPKVRVYEAEIMSSSVEGKMVNKGIAVCHLDTSDWSAGHGAFLALGYGPGIIEVCHWIYENDMTWSSTSSVAEHHH